ncbi:uncharacterized protein LOC118763242 [Octopus sinensis]|uniref:Uncharacterized protein LOC118763242 n=1 Tax=Octopus sinensis TaxID=2607531 RepID=A0A7E6EUC8_9MOLL|nr:uncharacterized protein LOC118763242 [Octopus sinensis]
MLRDERNAVCFGYDLLSIGALRGKMINQFIRILLPYTGYGAFEIVALPYCPQTFSIPLTPIHSETKLNVTNTAKNVSNLEAVISKMSQTIQSKLDLNNRSTDHFNVIIYFDSSVNIITPNIIEEIGKLRKLNCKIFLVNIGYNLMPQHLILKSLNCHILQVPTYEDMLIKARNTPFYFRPLLNLS